MPFFSDFVESGDHFACKSAEINQPSRISIEAATSNERTSPEAGDAHCCLPSLERRRAFFRRQFQLFGVQEVDMGIVDHDGG